MGSRVSLSRRDAEVLTTYENTHPFFAAAAKRLRAALAPKPKRIAAKKARKAAKATKRATKRERRASVREQVMERAGGVCECGCGRPMREEFFVMRPTLDHFWGRARAESVETCWALADDCHYLKTNNSPTAAYWLEKFAAHCDLHAYAKEASRAHARLASLADVAAAAALTKEAR